VSSQFFLLASAVAQKTCHRLGKGDWHIWLNPCSA